MLATKTKLEEELKSYKSRVAFLEKYTNFIFTNDYASEIDGLEAHDKAYRLQSELTFKKTLIKQREGQIKQIEEQHELKIKAVEEMPLLIEKSKSTYDLMLDDLEKLKKAKKTKEIREAIKMVELQVDEVSDLIDGIELRFNENSEHKQLLNDFRQLHNILKLKD